MRARKCSRMYRIDLVEYQRHRAILVRPSGCKPLHLERHLHIDGLISPQPHGPQAVSKGAIYLKRTENAATSNCIVLDRSSSPEHASKGPKYQCAHDLQKEPARQFNSTAAARGTRSPRSPILGSSWCIKCVMYQNEGTGVSLNPSVNPETLPSLWHLLAPLRLKQPIRSLGCRVESCNPFSSVYFSRLHTISSSVSQGEFLCANQ